ncbi:glucoamylase [Mycena floridula]|nr:glucoamylase [Mycena floridula]
MLLTETLKAAWYALNVALAVSSVTIDDLDSFISSQRSASKELLLANIGPNFPGAAPGVVIASPSTVNPNYLYTWIRDSSLVFQVLIDQYTSGVDKSLRPLIEQWIATQSKLQHVSNPSGNISTGGLGEPKFMINVTAFTDSWGRPQNDCPAERLSAIITFANYLLSTGNKTYVKETLWPIVKLDLDYVAQRWNTTSFDLWEEVNSASFFTTAYQHKALRMGTSFGKAIGQNVDDWQTQADNVLCFLQSFYTSTGYILSNTGGGRSGLDANSVLASIHTWDPEAGCDSTTFQPCSDKSLSNLHALVESFRPIYAINSGKAENEALAIGRYKEDVYFGGNPWYLTTLAVAEQLYYALASYSVQKKIAITSISLPFFQSLAPPNVTLTQGSFASGSKVYSSITAAMKRLCRWYTPSNGSLSEQYDKNSGTPLSAVDLTWSFASFITMIESPFTVSRPSDADCQVDFSVNATTVFGQNVYIVGSIPALANWDTSKALLMDSSKYPIWTLSLNLPIWTSIEFKHIRKDTDGTVEWESDPNRLIQTPGSGTVNEDDVWR